MEKKSVMKKITGSREALLAIVLICGTQPVGDGFGVA